MDDCKAADIVSRASRQLVDNLAAVFRAVFLHAVVCAGKIDRFWLSGCIVCRQLHSCHIVIDVSAKRLAPVSRADSIEEVSVEHDALAVCTVFAFDLLKHAELLRRSRSAFRRRRGLAALFHLAQRASAM